MWSLKSKSVLGAVVPAISLIGVLAVVTGFCGWNAALSVPVVGAFINAFSPATSMVMLVNPWEHVNQFARPDLVSHVTLFLATAFACVIYVVVVYSMLQQMVRRFDHTVQRLTGTG